MATSVTPSTKLHWTQRPENKAKVQAMARRGSKTRNAAKKKNGSQQKPKPETQNGINVEFEKAFAYALGYVECWIENYSQSTAVPAEALASRLGKVLQGKKNG
jgi:hypothetical protein